MRLEEGLGVALTVVTSHFNNCHFIVCLVILTVDTSCTIESYKLIGTSSSFNFNNNRFISSTIIVCNSNKSSRPSSKSCNLRIDKYFSIIVPANLPALGTVPAHFSHVIRIKRIAHQASVIGIRSSVKPTGVSQVEIVLRKLKSGYCHE
jgi:hypothetical protein